MGRQTQYCQDISFSDLDTSIQCSPSQNPIRLFCEYQQSNSKVYMERQKIQVKQFIIERGLTRLDFKTYSKVTVIKTAYYG